MSVSVSVINRRLAAHAFDRIRPVYRFLDFLAPVADLLVRLWVANVFFKAGLTKMQSFDTTVLLFTYEYQVPLLPPAAAAFLGTAAELTLPVFLALGLAGRLSAAALFMFNIVAVISYPALNAAGLLDHALWGILLLVTVLHGPGRLSVDYLIDRYFR
ncbi:MAG: DoxX family protein, partial [Pseudomonadota bacterium]|nr:DoxX family protein [Pseudomonadota bacterium]